MKVSLTKGLEGDFAKEVRANFKEALVFRKRLEEVLNEKIESARNNARLKSSYDNPNWAYLQADAIGYERGLREAISLLQEK